MRKLYKGKGQHDFRTKVDTVVDSRSVVASWDIVVWQRYHCSGFLGENIFWGSSLYGKIC